MDGQHRLAHTQYGMFQRSENVFHDPADRTCAAPFFSVVSLEEILKQRSAVCNVVRSAVRAHCASVASKPLSQIRGEEIGKENGGGEPLSRLI